MRRHQLSLFTEDGPRPPTLRDVADAVREAGIEGLPGARRRADEASYQEIEVRSAVAAVKGMPFRWALNPYRGCTHAYEYCYARKYQRHLELGAGDDFSSLILVKTNLPGVLRRELRKPSWAREGVAVGTATDPYQPIEGHYRITRRCLEVLCESRTPFSIVTRGPMVLRDRDLLVRATAGAGCRVFMSVPAVDEDVWTRLEPGTARPAQRLRAVRQLADAGVETGVLMMPLVPGISTSRTHILRTVEAIHRAGVPFAGFTLARLDEGVKAHFLAFLAREYPSLVSGYERLYGSSSHATRNYQASVRRLVAEARDRVFRTVTAPVPPPTTGSEP